MAAQLSLPTIPEALGARLIGTGLDVLLLGLVSNQVCTYAAEYGSTDGVYLRLYVAGLASLVWAKSLVNLVYVWEKFITRFGDPTNVLPAISTYENRLVGSLAILVVTTVCYGQLYYIYRLYSLSRKNVYITATLTLILVAAFVLSFASATSFATLGVVGAQRTSKLVRAAYPLIIIGDISLSFITAYFLLRFRQNAFAATANKLTRLIVLVFQTAAPATIIAVVDCVLIYVLPSLSAIPSSFLMTLANLWAFSVMWTLNERNDRRARAADGHGQAATAVHTMVNANRAPTQKGHAVAESRPSHNREEKR
ncbi:hypothetical protein MIND_00634500 [Mycena indigotica]|uniref:Uncharacterized protein n=1 Tax=Mycena indigotica TaxID=2126181 RepID=A0A8H6STE4_9AGAR|nr:uncharacterized protein MIND_00634500 [Mycena indigotica]KAF7304032.1 hypothetical protein MIND_00634500 [Mycena indigotica]